MSVKNNTVTVAIARATVSFSYFSFGRTKEKNKKCIRLFWKECAALAAKFWRIETKESRRIEEKSSKLDLSFLFEDCADSDFIFPLIFSLLFLLHFFFSCASRSQSQKFGGRKSRQQTTTETSPFLLLLPRFQESQRGRRQKKWRRIGSRIIEAEKSFKTFKVWRKNFVDQTTHYTE